MREDDKEFENEYKLMLERLDTCEDCGNKEYKMVTTYKIDHIEMEKDAICTKCGHKMGHWNTGYWEL